ncbi:MAG: protein kinase [Dermatophilaceae bacterium]
MPGFTISGELGSSVTGSTWAAVRCHDDRALVLRIIRVSDVAGAQAVTTPLMAALQRIQSHHLVHLHDAIALPDGTLALVFDQVTGGSLARVLGARGKLTPGETVTVVAPLFRALAELHAAGVVHGDLAPARVLFSGDGKPLISGLGVAALVGKEIGPADGASGFAAPELLHGAAASSASDVYAMAAIGWLCLTGVLPVAGTRPSSATASGGTPAGLVDVLTACLTTDPAARHSAAAAAVEVFDAAAAQGVHLGAVLDPAADITRRIRAAAVTAPSQALPTRLRHRRFMAVAFAALLAVSALGLAAAFLHPRPLADQPAGVRPSALPSRTPYTPAAPQVGPTAPQNVTEVATSPDSPRKDAPRLLQELVDSRALAYLARSIPLLDLVYAPGAARAAADRSNIATAIKNGATYLGLAFVVKDVAFVDGTSDTARIRATIVTPAYETGQLDGRMVTHPQETVGPSVFTLSWAPDGWRILRLTQP